MTPQKLASMCCCTHCSKPYGFRDLIMQHSEPDGQPIQQPSIECRFLPSLADSISADSTVVVFDVLRATTVMIEALSHGAIEIAAFDSIDETREFKLSGSDPDNILLGGERGGKKIEGFDLGNSPLEYNTEVVRGKTIAMTTTNGTRAIKYCKTAQEILIGSLSNVSALVAQLSNRDRIILVCAGTDMQITVEDVLAAGAVIDGLLRESQVDTSKRTLDDQAQIALAVWKNVSSNHQTVEQFLRTSLGGRNLLKLGYDEDIRFSAKVDRRTLVPKVSADGFISKSIDQRAPSDRPS